MLVKLRMSFLDELKNRIVVEAKASPSEYKRALTSPSELDYECLF